MFNRLTVLFFALAVVANADWYDTQTGRWHDSARTLPKSRNNTVGLRSMDAAGLAAYGILAAVTHPAPTNMVHTGAYTDPEVIDAVAYRTPICITAEEAAAIEAQRIGLLAMQHGAEVGLLAELLAVYDMTIPTTLEDVKKRIAMLGASGQMTSEQAALIGSLYAVYTSLAPVHDDVAAIWKAMQGGQ